MQLELAIAQLDARVSTRIAIMGGELKEQQLEMKQMNTVAVLVYKLETDKANLTELNQL